MLLLSSGHVTHQSWFHRLCWEEARCSGWRGCYMMGMWMTRGRSFQSPDDLMCPPVSPGGHMSNSSRDMKGRWRWGVWVGGVWYDDVTMPSVYRLFRLNLETWWIVQGSSSLVCRGFFTESSHTFRPAFVRFLGNVHINQKLTVVEEQERSVSNWSQTC